jgi:hypothetical protein
MRTPLPNTEEFTIRATIPECDLQQASYKVLIRLDGADTLIRENIF